MKKRISFLLVLCLLLSGCAGQAGSTAPSMSDTSVSSSTEAEASLDLQALYAQMTIHLPDMLVMDAGMMLEYLGIRETDCVQAVAAMSSINLQVDEVWLLEARDPEALDRLQALAQNRLTRKSEEASQFLPEQVPIMENAKLIIEGNYLLMLVGYRVDQLEKLCMDTIYE